MIGLRTHVAACFFAGIIGTSAACAGATGTAQIHQPDGSVKTYENVRIRIPDNQHLLLTSSDGKGTLVINKASCTAVAAMLRCLPYSGELDQHGNVFAFALLSGSVWLNLSSEKHLLPFSTAQLAPGGVLMAIETKRGTYVSLTGTIDEVAK
jgi:hypothetical protein